MGKPWDIPPYPTRGNSSRVLFESIGRALMYWEDMEGEFAHLYSTVSCGTAYDEKANREYGKGSIFAVRLRGLERMACRYFKKNSSQEREGKFLEIVSLATGYSERRNDIAHGRARFMHWILNPHSRKTLLTAEHPLKWCVIPAHFKGDKFSADNKPEYILTSREINRFAKAFWDIAQKTSALIHEIEQPMHFLPPPLR